VELARCKGRAYYAELTWNTLSFKDIFKTLRVKRKWKTLKFVCLTKGFHFSYTFRKNH